MVSVRFGNYEQFKEFFRTAPRNVQNILYKAYPDFARQLREEYINATKTIDKAKDTVSKATQTIKTNIPKAIGTAKEVTPTVSKGANILSKAKFVPGAIGGTWTILDPKTSWNQKVLGGMMFAPQTMPYATAGLITTEVAPKAIDSYYNYKLQNDPEYQQAMAQARALQTPAQNINKQTNIVPQPQPSNNYTAIQQMIINKALQKGIDPALALALVQQESGFNPNAKGDGGKSFGLFQIHSPSHPGYAGGLDPEANAEYGLNLLKSHLDRYGGDIDKALWAYNAGSGNLQKGILPASTKAYIANIKSNMGKFGNPQAGDYNLPQTQIPQNPQIAQQPRLNLNQDNLYLNQNQPTLNPIVDPAKLIGEVPDYQTWNINSNNQLQDLQNIVDKSNQIQGVQPMQNQAGNEALLEYLKMQNTKQEQARQLSADILAKYQQASRADAMQNFVNQMNNVNQYQVKKAPIYYVGANGNLNAIEQDQIVTPPRQLPTNTSTNVDKLLGELKIRQATQPTDNGATAQVLQAQALGNMYGIDPLVFLNPDIAKEYMKGQNTLENTRVTGQERRTDIPLNTQAKVIEENTKTAGRLAEAKARAYYDTILEGMKQQGMDRRQAEMLAGQQAMQVYNNEMRAYLQGQELDYKYYALPYTRDTQLMVANAYANRQQPDQELQDQYKRSQIYATGSTFANPQQQQAYWNYVTGGGVNPANIYGTSPEEDNILRNLRK